MRAFLVRLTLAALVFGGAVSCSRDPATAASRDTSTPAGRVKAAELVRRFSSLLQMIMGGAGKDLTDPEIAALRADSQALARSSEMSPEFIARFERLLSATEMFVDRYGTPAAKRDPAQLDRLRAFARSVQASDAAAPMEDRLEVFGMAIAEESALLAIFVEGTTDPARARAILEQRVGPRPK